MNSQQENEIISLSKQKWDWMSAQDVAPLDALFNEAAVFVHMGATFSKEEELDVIKSGYIHYRGCGHQGRVGPVHWDHRHRAHKPSARIRS
jgi:hypothetical protein